MAPEHREFLRFTWFDDAFKSLPKLISLRFTRVLFGLTCSPFLLNGTIKSHLHKYTQFTDIKKFVEKLIKRIVLKISSTFFDPLGIIIPITILAKVLYKDICLEKYSWDSKIRCNYIQKNWLGYLNELNTLSKVSVNLHVLCCDCRIVDVHRFCDSAGKACCAIVFARVSCSAMVFQ